MRASTTAFNVAWTGLAAPSWWKYRRALMWPERTQAETLRRYLRTNADTVFGRRNRFAGIRTVAEYQARVPLSTSDDYAGDIDRIAAGEPRVLTTARVHRFGVTSGSTRAAKLVPYTATLNREFSRAVNPWIADIFRSRAHLLGGPAYWSVTPTAAFASPARVSRVPIGFDEDSRYLGGVWHRLVESTFAVPPDVGRIADLDAFRYVTLLWLLRARELRLVSVWHPSFLCSLVESLPEWWDDLVEDVRGGTVRPPAPVPAPIEARLRGHVTGVPHRADELRGIGPYATQEIWPRLGLVSAWADGPAAPHVDGLRRLFPGATIQPKGLIATEAIVTIPFGDRHPLAIRSHFFEFEDDDARVRLAHELEDGRQYRVIVTTGGGLYRYRLADRVVVDGRAGRTPSLRFLGKEDRVSDVCGEKLHEGFVTAALDGAFANGSRPRFALLAPETSGARAGYTLFVDGPVPPSLATDLERALHANPHYAYAVRLGQLRPVRIARVEAGANDAYVQWCVAKGQRLGDVKPATLRPETVWRGVLRARDDEAVRAS